MLKFIVLGLIPGTNFQISFGWLLVLASLLVVGVIIAAELVLFPSSHQEKGFKTSKQKAGPKRHARTTQTA